MNERRVYSNLRLFTHALFDHACFPFDGFVSPWHQSNIVHAVAVGLVDRHECGHPVVVSPRLQLTSIENPTSCCPLINHLHPSPGRSWHRHQCQTISAPFQSSDEATPAPCSLSPDSVVRAMCSPSLPPSSLLTARPTTGSTNSSPHGGACAPYSRTTASRSDPKVHKLSTSCWECEN